MEEQKDKTRLNLPWLFKMAWRDSRRSRPRLFLFVSSIILGIAALVAIYSFGDNLRKDIDNQAASLLGADLSISSNKPIPEDIGRLLDSLGNDRSEQRSFASMIYFPKSRGTRLAQVKALGGNFPYYGSLETSPVQAGMSFRKGKEALVDKTLMMQFNASVGDSVKVGEVTFKIAGILEKAPGQTGISASVAPVVYIPSKYVEQTGLLKKGSRINYQYFYKFNKPEEVEGLVKRLEPQLEKADLNHQTVEEQKRDTGRSFEDLTRFLSLVGFVALLLGCIGVASAIHIYIREKLATIAILRCLGVKASQAFIIYLIQIVGIGLIGSIIGAVLGTVVQQVLPFVLKDILPVDISVIISWRAIFQGVVLGVIISVLFALLPLVSVRNISPLNTLRISYHETHLFKDPLKWLVYALILLFVVGFSYLQLNSWREAIYFTIAVVVAFLILTGTSALLIWLVRRFFPSSWSYLWRQGLANLFRPNNQTLILIVSIGLGTVFISTLFLVQDILLNRVALSASGNQPNMVLFDIQTNQKPAVAALTRSHGLPVISEVPIITMRIEEVNGYSAADVRKDSTIKVSRRAFNSELRVTYRDTLSASERITKGKWIGRVTPEGLINVSLEEGYANRIHVGIGDKITFNVQGALIPTVVSSFREVDWNRIQTNFRLVFPAGVLEDAPQFHVLMTRAPDSRASAKFQQAVVQSFPNISVIDLELVLSVLDEILDKIGFVIQFMAAFSIITGLIVLVASVLISKYQRIQESVLLRTLGGSKRQILIITALEYFFLGAFAAATGIILSLAGSWALAKFSFKTSFSPDLLPLLILFFLISCLTVIIGLINSRGILNRPPLQILRGD
ncbi:ABC transporter permease [Paradesertivirga mongoliensis]|uniref:ABC transporter permease n=1 Tax=Paradesertivirga mongoliensis TaxID=2100740 RepID=A0ABW4ZI45_9SPHI|nr:FtsX-like permease family protein [Pedobacter mongoliensis]